MNRRAKIAVVLGAIIIGLLVLFYLFNSDAPSAPPAPTPAALAKRIASATLVSSPLRPIAPAPPIAKAQILPPSLTPAQIAAFQQPLAVAAQNAPVPIASPTPEQIKTIKFNLRLIFNAAQSYMMEKSRNGAGYYDIVGASTDNYLHTVNPVVGEDYTGIHLNPDDTEVTITAPDGTVITYDDL